MIDASWLGLWGLARDPFATRFGPFVGLKPHLSVIHRLTELVDGSYGSIALLGEDGLGKSMIMREVLGQIRRPERQIVRVEQPIDSADLLARVAGGLGRNPNPIENGWREVLTGLELARLQGRQVLIAIDDDGWKADSDLLETLTGRFDVTILRVGRPLDQSSANSRVTVTLAPLTRSEARTLLDALWQWAGGDAIPLEPKAMTSLHSLAGGVPREILRISGEVFREIAGRRETSVSPIDIERAIDRRLTPGWSTFRDFG